MVPNTKQVVVHRGFGIIFALFVIFAQIGNAQNPTSNFDPVSAPSVAVAGATTPIFSDDFSGTFPAPNWIIQKNSPCGNGNITINQSVGNPAPSLEMNSCSQIQSAVSPFSVSGGVSISVDVALLDDMGRMRRRSLNCGDRTETVVLQLENVIGMVKGLFDLAEPHWTNLGKHYPYFSGLSDATQRQSRYGPDIARPAPLEKLLPSRR
jgi:hypothetical protein